MDIETLERMLAAGKDSALLRFGLGKSWLNAGDPVRAATHLGRCVVLDPDYSAAWKLLGKALLAMDNEDGAAHAWQQGIDAATARGDLQASKEMAVFLNRLSRKR